MEFHILGPLEVHAAGTVVNVGPPRQRTLLSVLLVHANQVVSQERLIEALWPDSTPSSAAATIHVRISELRKTFRTAHLDAYATIRTRDRGYQLVVDSDQIDAERFEQLAAVGRRSVTDGHPATARTVLSEALDLWHGAALSDVSHLPFADAERNRLDELRLQTIEERIDADLACGRHVEVNSELEALVAQHPLRETFWRQLILARYCAGRQPEALHAYQQARRAFVEELGIEPSPGLRQLQQAVLNHDPALTPTTERAVSQRERRSNLPVPVSSFIDREVDLATVTTLLDRGRLVTLTGAGGVGKSRLALEVASAQRANCPDGCWLVELSTIGDRTLVTPAIAAILGVHELPDRPLVELLTTHLHNARALLILDNCEHLLEEAATVAQRLLAACPRIHILATSRERIGIAGESIHMLAGLDNTGHAEETGTVRPSAATRLFLERAAAVRTGFQLTETTAPAVHQICQRLDGLPLAIELAAARMSALNADQIEARLDDRFSLLARGNRAARRHHQTLMAVFDWSYRLLDDAERRLFDRLSIFAGAFDLEAVDAVCIDHPGEDAADLMVRLVDKSLVYLTPAHSPTPRYLLLETLREYGWEHLQNTEQAAEMRRAHAAYYRSLAETAAAAFRGKDEASWLHRLVLDNGNLRAALGWTVGAGEPEAAVQFAGSLHHFWDMQGQYREGRLWLKQALELSSPANSTAHGWAWYGAGELAMIQGDFAESTHSFEQARDLFTAVGDATGLADSLRYLGFLCIHADERRAENLLTEALANARAAGSNYAEGWALLFLTVLSLARRNFEQARQRSIESERVLLAVGQRESIAWSRLTHGAAEWGLGNLAAAAEPVRDGLDIFAEIPGVWGISLGLLFAGLISRTGKDWPTAIRLLSASETVRESIGAGTQPFLEEWFAETVSEATTAIGTEAFDQHWEAGATAALDECLADARHALRRAKTYTG